MRIISKEVTTMTNHHPSWKFIDRQASFALDDPDDACRAGIRGHVRCCRRLPDARDHPLGGPASLRRGSGGLPAEHRFPRAENESGQAVWLCVREGARALGALCGRCTLFLADGGEDRPGDLYAESLEPQKIYCVKRGTWHSHTLSRDAAVLIVENEDTGDTNSPRCGLTRDQRRRLQALAGSAG